MLFPFFYLVVLLVLFYFLGEEEEPAVEVSASEGHFVCWTKPLKLQGEERLEDESVCQDLVFLFFSFLCVCASLPFGEEVKGRSNSAY